jgi:hypothetical protein
MQLNRNWNVVETLPTDSSHARAKKESKKGQKGLLVRAAATFRHVPVDVFLGCLDRATLTVKAILGVDLQTIGSRLFVLDVLVNLSWAETLFWAGIGFKRNADRYSLHASLNLKMGGLVVLMVGTAAR